MYDASPADPHPLPWLPQVLCVNDFGSLANYKIVVDGGGHFEFYQKRFGVLSDVIAFVSGSQDRRS